MQSNPEDLPAWALKMLASARVARLGLIDDRAHPRVLPVTFALHEGELFSALDEKRKRLQPRATARVRYLRANPRVALTVDHYEDDWSALSWVQTLGRADVIECEQAPDALAALRAKYRQYEQSPPPGPLIRIVPSRFICWRA
jgi:PPOX class probable F420-dependent enzyme